MVRAIAKQIEGAIALLIFVTFLFFYLGALNVKLFGFYSINYEKESKQNFIKIILNNISREYYIVSFDLEVPKYSKEYFCKTSDDDLKRDFCEKFPISYPLYFNFGYNGTINSSYYSFYDGILYMYANFSEFNECDSNKIVKVKIYNPNNYDLKDYQIFITSPTIRYWLSRGHHLNITPNYNFCYLHSNFVCNNIPDNAYGIWISISMSRGSYLELYITNTTDSTQNEKEGSKIFDFYDHFEYNNLSDLLDVWNVVGDNADCIKVNNTSWICYGNLMNTKNNVTLSGKYIIFYKIKNNIEENTKLEIGECVDRIDEYYGLRPFICSVVSKNIVITSESSKINVTLDYIVIKKLADLEPIIFIDEPICKKEHKLIIGPHIEYQYPNDLGIIDNFASGFYNKYLKYFYLSSMNAIRYNDTLIEKLYNIINYFRLLHYISKDLEEEADRSVLSNKTIALEHVYYGNYGNFTYILRRQLFSDSRWFLTNLELVFYNSTNFSYSIINWSSLEHPNIYGEIFPFGTANSVYATIYGEDLPFSKITSVSVDSDSILFKYNGYSLLFYFDNYMTINLSNIVAKRFYVYNLSYYRIEDYKLIKVYTYAVNKTINYFDQIMFRLPRIKIKSVKRILAIPIEYIIIPEEVSLYFEKLNKKVGNLGSYSYVEKIPVYVFYNNSIIKDNLIIYIK